MPSLIFQSALFSKGDLVCSFSQEEAFYSLENETYFHIPCFESDAQKDNAELSKRLYHRCFTAVSTDWKQTNYFVFVHLTGILLLITPGYVADKPLFPVPTGLGGHVFCALLGNRYLLFTVAKVSILLVTCLAVERWYCVMRPVVYMMKFDRRRLLIYVVLSWVITCALQSHKFFQVKLIVNKCVTVDAPRGEEGPKVFIAVYSFSAFVIPCIVTWLTFAHIRCRAHVIPKEAVKSTRREKQNKLLLRMCAITAAVFTLCWLPAQLSYTLTPFGITRVNSLSHKACNCIAFLNSCINPFIYWYYHKEYRKEFIKLFCVWKLGGKVIHSKSTMPLDQRRPEVDQGATPAVHTIV